jgi:hypothetical protein
MHLAIIDDRDEIFVEYSEEVFRKLLKKYFEETKDIETAFNQVVAALRNLTYRK